YSKQPVTTLSDTLSLHDALPICSMWVKVPDIGHRVPWYLPISGPASITMWRAPPTRRSTSHSGTKVFSGPHHCRSMSGSVHARQDRKSTRLNSSHVKMSYAVFCM